MKTKTTWIIVIITSLAFYWLILRPQQKNYNDQHVPINGVYLIKPIPVGNFEVIDHKNRRFNQDNLKNHWTLLFFGFTSCNNVCPTTLNILNKTYGLIQKQLPQKDWPQILFITIDPERDTLARLKKYVSTFNPDFIAARTTAERTKSLEKQFHVIALKENNTTNINHSPEVLLINPDGKIQAYFSFPQQPEKWAKDYHHIITH